MRMDQDASYDESAAEVKQADRMMVKRVFGGELDMDQESTGSSSEEMESPRSVVKATRRLSNSREKNRAGIGMCVHSQILRIRDEDSHIAEDISTDQILSLSFKDDKPHPLASLVVFSRPIPPGSPLGGKNIVHTSDSLRNRKYQI